MSELTFNSTVPLVDPLIEPGKYKFAITSMTQAKRKVGSLGDVWCADLTVHVFSEPEIDMKESLKLAPNLLFILGQFFACIGVRKHGDTAPMTPAWWSKVKGATGTCEIEVHKWNDQKTNRVKKWLSPEDAEDGGTGME